MLVELGKCNDQGLQSYQTVYVVVAMKLALQISTHDGGRDLGLVVRYQAMNIIVVQS